jgi:hypothetical protein
MFLRLAFLLSAPVFGAYTQSAAVNLPTYAQGLTNFPYLISCNSTVQSCPQFKTVANGGQVQNSNGFDIAFYADSGCSTTKLNWETEDWSATTGNGDWWVQVPASTNTFYECWDNTSISTDQSNKTGTWSTENYQFVMHGGTPSSFSTADSSANNLSGTATSITAVAGIVNGAGVYNGSSSFVSYTNPTPTQCSPACTLEAWIKTSTVSSGNCVVANQWHFGPSPSFGIETCTANQLSKGNAHVAWGNSSGFEAANAMYPLADGNWHLLAMTFSSGTVNFFVDGVLRASWLSTNTTISYSTENLTIGCDSNGSPGGFFTGDIDEVRISSDAKTPAWENAAYQNVANAELTVQPVKIQPLLMSTMYFGGNSCSSSGMTVGASLDGINFTSIYNYSLTNMQIPLFLEWNGYLWLAYTTSTGCGVSSGITILKTPLPLTLSSTFSSVATVSPTGFGSDYIFATNWFVGDDGIPNLVLNIGTNTAASVYLVVPTDTTGLTTWNTSTIQLTSSGYYTDPQLIELNPSSFVLMVKDSSADTIGYFTASSKTGTYTLQTNDLGFGTTYEAPHAIQTSPGTWTLYLDAAGSSLHYATTTSFPTGWSGLTTYPVYNCGDSTGNPSGYCFHPVPFTVQGKNGVQ